MIHHDDRRRAAHVSGRERAPRLDRDVERTEVPIGDRREPNAGRFVSLEDEIVTVNAGRVGRWLAALATRTPGRAGDWLAALVVRRAQRSAERLHSRVRRDLVRYDERLETTLAFAGRPE